MKKNDPAFFHKLYGIKKPKAVYYKTDFLDYVLMMALSALAVGWSYGVGSVMSIAGLVLCAFTLAMFVVRHGVAIRVPLILKRPQDVLYMLAYKIGNLRPVYFIALGLLLLENVLISATPGLPHRVELMRRIFLYLFYIHFVSITLFRTVILADHLAKKELVREVLMQTPWKRMIKEDTNMVLEILHAYSTGVLTHIILIAPWYIVITHAKFSLIFLPVVCVINGMVYKYWVKVVNEWFYRDHWLGHNSELEFIFLHGGHHDAIPSGMIAVAENGLLEGFLRFTLGAPTAFFNPVISFLIYTIEVQKTIAGHQYIPGVFPRISRDFMEVYQHATHHYGPIVPYSFAFKLDQPNMTEEKRKAIGRIPPEIENSAKLDEELSGFQWDNPTYRRTLSLYDKYQK
jgi:hypothetical protein